MVHFYQFETINFSLFLVNILISMKFISLRMVTIFQKNFNNGTMIQYLLTVPGLVKMILLLLLLMMLLRGFQLFVR